MRIWGFSLNLSIADGTHMKWSWQVPACFSSLQHLQLIGRSEVLCVCCVSWSWGDGEGVKCWKWSESDTIHVSILSIFAYIWLIFLVNIGRYTIHGCYGNDHGETKQILQGVLMTLAKGFCLSSSFRQRFLQQYMHVVSNSLFLFIKRSSILDTLDLLDCCVSKMARLADLEKKAVRKEYVEWISCLPGSINAQYFHAVGDGHQPYLVGVYRAPL